MNANVRRGDIYYADLSPVVGSEQGGMRPVLIIQNDVGNRYSPTVIAAAITSRMGKTKLPTHIDIYAERAGLSRDSIVLLEQLRTLDKRRLKEKMGHLDDPLMHEIDTAIAVSLGLLPHSAAVGSTAGGTMGGAATGGAATGGAATRAIPAVPGISAVPAVSGGRRTAGAPGKGAAETPRGTEAPAAVTGGAAVAKNDAKNTPEHTGGAALS